MRRGIAALRNTSCGKPVVDSLYGMEGCCRDFITICGYDAMKWLSPDMEAWSSAVRLVSYIPGVICRTNGHVLRVLSKSVKCLGHFLQLRANYAFLLRQQFVLTLSK